MGGRLRHHFEEKIAAMPLPAFDELPFNARPDLTPYLLHLTKNTEPEDDLSAYDNLVSILKTGEIRGSSSRNPMGARALYMHKDGVDTYYRVHGTNDPTSIGRAVSAGCIRLLNQDIVDLHGRVQPEAKIVVR